MCPTSNILWSMLSWIVLMLLLGYSGRIHWTFFLCGSAKCDCAMYLSTDIRHDMFLRRVYNRLFRYFIFVLLYYSFWILIPKECLNEWIIIAHNLETCFALVSYRMKSILQYTYSHSANRKASFSPSVYLLYFLHAPLNVIRIVYVRLAVNMRCCNEERKTVRCFMFHVFCRSFILSWR